MHLPCLFILSMTVATTVSRTATIPKTVTVPKPTVPKTATAPKPTVIAPTVTKPTVAQNACRPIHSQAHGVNLICCGGNSSSFTLPDHCEYSTQCAGQDECSCAFTMTERLNCTRRRQESAYNWVDHSPGTGQLECDRPNLPGNDTRTAYSVRIEKWMNNTTSPLLLSLCSLNVTTLTILDKGDLLSTMDLTKCMPKLLVLDITLKTVSRLDIYQLFRSLRWLQSLRIVNVHFDFWHSISPWIASLSYLHLENSSLRELPRWMANARQLKRIFVKGTRIFSADTIANMTALQSVKLSKNQIGSLYSVAFKSASIFDVDLSFNKISSISSATFSKCTELRVLDLSYNPLEDLPLGAFASNSKLKWLKLDYTKIKTLLPEHFNGLTHLRTLSLSNTPLRMIGPYSLVPLKSLRVLNLNGCNLTEIPQAVVHICHLTHLNLADNLLRNASSLPSDVIVHLSGLSQLSLEGNPLKEFPAGLLMLSPFNTRLVRDTIRSLIILPVWSADPCTPFYFNMHLSNSSAALRNLVVPWNIGRMKKEGLIHCRDQYERMAASMNVYQEIEKSSGCSVSRRLRSATDCPPTPPNVNQTIDKKPIAKAIRPHPLQRTRSPILGNRIGDSRSDSSSTCPVIVDTSHVPLLYLSVALNAFFVSASSVFVCMCCAASRRMRY